MVTRGRLCEHVFEYSIKVLEKVTVFALYKK